MRRRRGPSVAGNPVLIGASTTLIVLVAVFLAYNANNGLPFTPSYEVKAQLPDAANLVKGNEVRMGGARVGVVSGIKALNNPQTGAVTAEVDLKLQTGVKPLPTDSTVIVRSKSALGLKYVQITRGQSKSGFADGDLIPLSQAKPTPVEIDQVLNTFDARTRAASQQNLLGFGDALAGRGPELNTGIASLPALLRGLVPVMQNLAAPQTQLGRLFRALGRAAAIVAPAAQTQAQLFDDLDITFAALARVARPFIQDSITGAPPALQTATRELPRQRAFLANSAAFFHELRPGVRALRRSAPALAQALVEGTPTLRRLVEFNQRLTPTFQSLRDLVEDPLVPLAVQDLVQTATTLQPTVNYIKPTQTLCNYATLWFRNIASLLSEGDANGTWQRFIIIATPQGPNNEGGPSSAPANGPTADNHLHNNPYPYTGAPGQPRECEAANESYAVGQTVVGNTPGNTGTGHDATTPNNP